MILTKQQGFRFWLRGQGFLFCCLLLLNLLAAGELSAAVSGRCSDCHTMHHSQDGQVLSSWGAGGPYNALLVNSCAGCHMGTNVSGSTPYVFSSVTPLYGLTGTEANTNTLAGGSFYWVAQALSDRKGHNIANLATPDMSLAVPPGFDGTRQALDGSSPGGGSWPNGQQVTCAGTYGCHGTHAVAAETTAIRGGHHYGIDGAITTASTEPAESYRMLVGIVGYEDPEWELTPTVSAHNQYKGVDQATDMSTISALCGLCHGDFHQQTVAGPWTLHPVDYDMSNTAATSEYRQYGGVAHDYQPAAPLASTLVDAPLGSVTFSGDAIVSCVSCHRAHGSPYDKLLRWDYANSVGTGCVYCHTSKN